MDIWMVDFDKYDGGNEDECEARKRPTKFDMGEERLEDGKQNEEKEDHQAEQDPGDLDMAKG
ncbi:hypothetical protein N7508_004348 [Penicillium antarcticum]|uniref:uncharacterized protein n=1 Tax=Penicillium antarcticum TaxID=416450 RepID=UPI0023A084B0|nr:uncharacterized protein N7508_004348 [Penicillium antarcticum]KAJ5308969.1 hypothetical protein N7508_004348 [Penicillium antarcticum]